MSKIPEHFCTIGPCVHPISGESGVLLRSRNTGVYSFLSGNKYQSAPYRWAQVEAARMGKASDQIQEACIKRMQSLNMKPIDVAKLLPAISEKHICDYLSRSSSMNSHKVSKILPALGLQITPIP